MSEGEAGEGSAGGRRRKDEFERAGLVVAWVEDQIGASPGQEDAWSLMNCSASPDPVTS